MIREFAPAKINLYLHITGRRADGYHILDSLVAFAGVGDEIRLEEAPRFDFIVDGPQAALLKQEADKENLVVRAAAALAQRVGKPLDVRLTLIKNLPVASGIGGGSSDAAAALRALATYWDLDPDDQHIQDSAAENGQDVPVCLVPESCYIIEDGVAPAPELPHIDVVLVNPGKALATIDAYKTYKEMSGAFSQKARLETAPADAENLVNLLKARTNDLQVPAVKLLPEIDKTLSSLQNSSRCLMARMSGSGATCFGLYPDRDSARRAASDIHAAHPDWWVIQTHIPCRRDRRRRPQVDSASYAIKSA